MVRACADRLNSPAGASASPLWFLPQQVIVLSARTLQRCKMPGLLRSWMFLLTALNSANGACIVPAWVQQVIVSSPRTPQPCPTTALSVLNAPASASVTSGAYLPQQVIVLSTRTPQLYPTTALTFLNSPAGASVSPYSFKPQQVIVLSTRTPQVCQVPTLTVLNSPGPNRTQTKTRSGPSR